MWVSCRFVFVGRLLHLRCLKLVVHDVHSGEINIPVHCIEVLSKGMHLGFLLCLDVIHISEPV